MAGKNKFVKAKLEWALRQIETWQAYVDANPFDKMEDRIRLKETKSGGVIPVPTATIEQQQKSVRETIKDYLMLMEIIEMRLAEEEAKESNGGYGGVQESIRMKLAEKEKEDEH